MDILKNLLKLVVENKASDLYLKTGIPPHLRIDGKLSRQGESNLTSDDLRNMAYFLMSKEQRVQFAKEKEMDLAFDLPDAGRFRANIFVERGNFAIVLRIIKAEIPSFKELNLPAEVLEKLSLENGGLVLITGPVGSGKSTAAASMIEYINLNVGKHIVTIEDPIEFIFEGKKSIISQREIGLDTLSYSLALKHVLRQTPDVIFIGDIRDLETMSTALSAAETGHLVVSILHTINAVQTVERVVNFFSPHQHPEIRTRLSLLLNGVISLRLLSKKDGDGRIPAYEVMLSTPTIRSLILSGKTTKIASFIQEGAIFGMQTFNQSLVSLCKEGLITSEEAKNNTGNLHELELALKGFRHA